MHEEHQTDSESAEGGRYGERWDVRRSILGTENVARDETREGGDRLDDGCDDRSFPLVRRVVIIPGREQRRRHGAAGAEQEAGEIRHALVGHHVDLGEDDETDHGAGQASNDVESAVAEVVGRDGEADKRQGPDDVRGDGEQVGCHRVVTQALHDLDQKVADAEQRDTIADADHHVREEKFVLVAHFEGIFQHELRVDHVR